jgi:hypothetical protein
MTTNYIQSNGAAAPVLTLVVAGSTSANDAPLAVPTLQDVTINNANDVFTWSQLNESAKLQVATTATNSISSTIVVEADTFFGLSSAEANSAARLGLIGLSRNKTEVTFTIAIGAKTLSGRGYVTGLAPTTSADAPVWTTPITITVSGEYTVA